MPEPNVSGGGILFQFTACLLECAPIILVDLHGGEREKDRGGEEGRKGREGGMKREDSSSGPCFIDGSIILSPKSFLWYLE